VSALCVWLVVLSTSFAQQQPQGTLSSDQADQAELGAPQVLLLPALHGYIEPCGCTIDLTLGSLERLVVQIKEARKRGPTALIVAGGHLFEHKELPEHRHAQDLAKARLLRETLAELDVDLIAPGPQDLALGAEQYAALSAERPAPDPTVNIEGGAPQLLTLGDLKLGVFALGPVGEAHPSGLPYLNPAPTARAAAALLKAQGAHVILALSDQPRAELRALAQELSEVDVWALSEGAMEMSAPSPIEGAEGRYLIEAGDRGRNLASLSFYQATSAGPLLDPHGVRARQIKELELKLKMKRKLSGFGGGFGGGGFGGGGFGGRSGHSIADLEAQMKALKAAPISAEGKRLHYELTPITTDLPADPEVKAKVSAYHASLQALNLQGPSATPVPLPEGGNGYAKTEECALCHSAAVDFWRTTSHARAWETLEKANKTFDVECVSCHVTGFRQPGGSALGHTEGLQDVQCEACHGPSAQHAEVGGGESGTRLKVGEGVCAGCHPPEHSPRFSYPEYRAKILGPGHGEPVVTP
jgi:hypothetical protein